jgi:hypothetical protein
MSFLYTPAKVKFLTGVINLASDDIRVLMVMSNTTADTDQDVENIADIGTLDEYGGTNYARKTLAGKAVNEDDPNNRGEFDATDIVWTALGAGARNAVGLVVYKHVTNDADAILIAYIDSGGFPTNGNGNDFTVTWNAEGILQGT